MTDQMTATEIANIEAAKRVTSFMDPAVWVQMQKMAETLRQSGMLPKGLDTVPKILVVMQTGFENGLKPMEAFNSLYVVNGAVNFYGKAVTRRFREHGWMIAYENETEGSVTAVVTNKKDSKEVYRETYTFAEAEKSGYTRKEGNLKFGWKEGFNRRLKLRYGALSIILKTYIPEILGSARGIVEVEEDTVLETVEEVKPTSAETPPPSEGIDLDSFVAKAQEEAKPKKKAPEPKPEPKQEPEEKPKKVVKPIEMGNSVPITAEDVANAMDAEIIVDEQKPEITEDRKILNRRYFALLKSNGTDHETAKGLFKFEHLADLTDQELKDIVADLAKSAEAPFPEQEG